MDNTPYVQRGTDTSLEGLYLSDSDSTGPNLSQQKSHHPSHLGGTRVDYGLAGVNSMHKIEEEPLVFSSDSSLTNSEQFGSDSYSGSTQQRGSKGLMALTESLGCNVERDRVSGSFLAPHIGEELLFKGTTSSDSSLTNSEYVSLDQSNESGGISVANQLFGTAPSLKAPDDLSFTTYMGKLDPKGEVQRCLLGEEGSPHIDSVPHDAFANLSIDADHGRTSFCGSSSSPRLPYRRGSNGSAGSSNSMSSGRKSMRRGSNSSAGSSGSRSSDGVTITANIVSKHKSPTSSPPLLTAGFPKKKI